MKGLQLQVSLHFGTRTGPYSVRFPAAVIETKMRHSSTSRLELQRPRISPEEGEALLATDARRDSQNHGLAGC